MNDRLLKYKYNEMDRIFESWEMQMFWKVEALDEVIRRILAEMGMFGVPEHMRVEYMRAKLQDMIEQLAEQRETAKGA